jgi:hypothetical protein
LGVNALFWLSYAALILFVVMEGGVLLGLLSREAQRRNIGRTREQPRMHVERGMPLPSLEGIPGPAIPKQWAELESAEMGLLLFFTPHCASCNRLGPQIERWLNDRDITAVVVVEGPPAEAEGFAARAKILSTRTITDQWGVLGAAIGCEVRPGAVTTRRGKLGMTESAETIEELDRLIGRERDIHPAAPTESGSVTGGAI